MDNINDQTYQQAEEEIDIKNWLYKFVDYWAFFLVSILVALTIAFLFNRLTSPVYEVETTVLVKDEKNKIDPAYLLGGIGMSGQQNIQNEIAYLMSYSLNMRAIKKMNYEVAYFDKSNVITQELYKTAPFTVELDFESPQAVNISYNISILNNRTFELDCHTEEYILYNFKTSETLEIKKEKIEFSGNFNLGEWIDNKYNRFRILLNENYSTAETADQKYFFVINNYASALEPFREFQIDKINREASIISISLRGNNERKLADFLNTLTSEYIQRGLEKKNQIAENTIAFIDEQLIEIETSLSKAEIDLQNFQTRNELMNIDYQSTRVFDLLKDLEKQKAELLIKAKYYKSLQSYIQSNIDNLDKLVAPSSMGIDDPLLNRLVQELVNLSGQKSEKMQTSTDQHPQIVSIDAQITNTKHTLLENINNIINNSNLALNDVDRRVSELEKQLVQLPETQRQLLGYQRKFELNESLYNFLMQKRSEAQITKASNLPDNEIIDEAGLTKAKIIFPKKAINYLVAFVLGLIIPFIYIFLREYLNNKIITKSDVSKITRFPIIGTIFHNEKDSKLTVLEHPKSSLSESFRSTRTNIEYLSQGKNKNVILVMGDIVNVGKTFVSINLASIYSLYGKKTILLGFDLRKPKIYQDFGLSNTIGLSSYLIGKQSLDEIIQPSSKIEHLDIITAGKIPPNPAELIASEKCSELFEELRKRYDYIIIDTPPIALVTDAFLLMKHADVTIFVVRQNYTHKKIFENLIRDLEDRKLNISILINDMKPQKGYGYGYGYSYGYGYYSDEESKKKGIWKNTSKKT